MIQIIDKSLCCGCSACMNICAKHAIVMEEDEQGFLYPKVDEDLCVDCHLCEKVCPFIHQKQSEAPAMVCAAKNKDDKIRKLSSSGGIFTLIAEYVICKGGVVFGAKFNERWQVIHGYTDTLDGISSFRGSKYVQSVIGDTYSQARDFLAQGRYVLFTGTPCQILGLKNYLRKDYDNLLTLEVVCHGVPSPRVWREYLEEVIRTNGVDGKNTDLLSLNARPEITGIAFRDKRLGWKKYGFVVQAKVAEGDKNSDLSSIDEDSILLDQEAYQNPYLKCFIKNVYLRPSCHSCKVKAGHSGADFALADFWAIDRFCHSFSDNYGVTLLYAVSEKASKIVDNLNIEKVTLNTDEYLTLNRAYAKSAEKNKYSDLFWKEYQSKGIQAIYSISDKIKPTFKQKLVSAIRKTIKKIILR